MIDKIALPNTNCHFSALSLGTVKFGRDQSVKYPGQFTLPTDEDLRNLLDDCIELGISTFDTAPAYGFAEERLGKLLSGKRQQFEIITKAGESYSNKSDKSYYDFSVSALQQQLDQSLRHLKTDYLDCWMLHSNGDDVKNLNDDVIQCLLDAKQSGKVKSVGMSGKTVDGGTLALEHLDTIMMTRNLQYQDEDSLLAVAARLNKKVFLKKIFNSGWIVNTETNKAQAMQKTFQHCFNSPQICSAVLGTINPKHLVENVEAWQTSQNT
ncbi:MAG: aldo/keto reductase [Sinobacterium sp.]|nr:aldo/keto reductase [Sinobacterium sp.]